jgi:LPXTG-motif cell wall-anchored protein
VIAVAAASGAMAMTMPAFAGSGANGSAAGSPGLISGNVVQVPVHVPVNLCGNTVNVVGALNPAIGNACANKGSAPAPAVSGGGAEASGVAVGSPGVVSGNGAEVPVDVPVNASGTSVDVVGILNPVFGNKSENTPDEEHAPPAEPGPDPGSERPRGHMPPDGAHSDPQPTPKTVPPARAPQVPASESAVTALAETGTDATVPALLGGTALILGGALLYRRFKPGVEG